MITFYRSERSLRIDCNEVGFSQDDVDAICRIGRSTKSTSSSSTRYIGEKGVGFKSVFKVADEVHLQSGNYSFKFDRNAKLGMIAPIWATFPGSVRPGGSSILLRLSGDSYCDELEQELKMLDPRLLLFLRKLERIEVMSFNRLGSITASTLQRNEEVASLDRAKMISVSQNKTATRFKIIEVDINRMPYDARREGCTISKLLLGFPVDERNDPSIAYQKAYAFLPIRDYGCKVSVLHIPRNKPN